MMSEDQIRAGDTFGRYELLCAVGRGGMAVVWAARHQGLYGFSKIVALKTMLPSLCDDTDFQRMFLTEARLAARIRHPNVVETLDLGEEGGLLYIVMEWMDGETLSSIMKSSFLQGGVPLPIALKLVIDACAGAHAAHELCDDDNRPIGLVHRDVSPPNVLVSYDGVVKLADFGVAKTMAQGNTATVGGLVKGKVRYMSPEQLLSAPLDRRTDVFALGITLYQLTAGRHPWPGDTAAVTIGKMLSEGAAPPASFVDGYPVELEHIVLKALARNPSERFQTAAEMALALEEFARATGGVATTRELGAYVTGLLGHHGESRRATLRHAIREADLRNLRKTLKELEPGAEDPRAADSIAPAMHANEIASIRPWTSYQSAPPLALHSDSVLPRPLFPQVSKLISMSRSAGSKRVFLLGGAVLFMTVVYGLSTRQPATDASASAAPPPVPALVLPALASPVPSECTPYSAPSSAPASSAQPAAVVVRSVHHETLRPPTRLLRGAKSVALPEARPNEEAEVDVGF